jgi:uncharacterized protein (DUF427 family)
MERCSVTQGRALAPPKKTAVCGLRAGRPTLVTDRGISMRVRIYEQRTGALLADASGDRVAKVEGNWYIDASAVSANLQMSSHDYTCPYKGKCYYADFVDGATRAIDVAWVYGDPKPGWEHIKGKYGFYAGNVRNTRDEVTP